MPTVAPDKILKQLADLWVSTARQGDGDGGEGVLRACAMTLVVLTEESEDVSTLGETLAALMPEHPARAIVIRLRGAGERDLAERVYAQCWKPFGQRRQICCEQVEIIASDAALADVPSVVLPLAVADLPVVFWCRSPRVVQVPEFRELTALATRIIVDSGAFPDPVAALQWLDEAVKRPRPLMADLAWTRLTRWRETLSQVFENRQNLARLAGTVQVLIGDTGAVATRALYFGAWVKDGLESLGAMVPTIRIVRSPMPFIELATDGFKVRLEREDERLITTIDSVAHCTSLPLPTDYLLLREELGIMRRDPVFEKTLSSATRVAYATE